MSGTSSQADMRVTKKDPTRLKVCETCRRKKQEREFNTKSRCSMCRERCPSGTRNEERHRADMRRRVMINRLETNIERMESRLHDIGLNLIESRAPATQVFRCSNVPASRRPEHETSHPDFTSFHPSGGPDPMSTTTNADANPAIVFSCKHVEGWPPSLASFVTPGSMVDVPLAGGFSAISKKGMEWISQKAGNISLKHLSSLLSVEDHDESTANCPLNSAFTSRVFCSLPTREETVSLVHDYIENFNVLFPVFQRSELLALFNQESLDMSVQTPSQWACINAVLATAHMLRPDDGRSGNDDHQKSWLFIQNALEVVNEICLGPPDLLALQALVIVATFILGTSTVHPCGFLVSAAIRICHELGLGKTEDGSPLCAEETQHRQTVFWIAYWLDRELSLRFGEPPAQSDEDFSATLPMEAPIDSNYTMQTSDLSESFNAFRSTCQLAIIKGQLYRELYSPGAEDRPLSQVIASVGILDEKLQEWKRSIPLEYQPEKAITNFRRAKMSPVLLLLHYSYFHCMIAVHRRVAARDLMTGMDFEKNDFTSSPASFLNPRVLISTSLCTKAARASISLTNYLSQENIPFFGSLLYYPVVASMTLSWSIIRDPQDAYRGYNLKLIDQTAEFLSSQAFCKSFDGIRRLVKQCAEYRSIAEAVVKTALSARSDTDT